MIANKGLPGLQWPIWSGHHIDRNRGLGDLDAELEQLAMDLGGAPQGVFKTHSSDQVTLVFADLRSASERTGPSPVSGKALSVPTHNRLRPHDGYSVKDARAAAVEPNEHGTVGPTQMQSTSRALLQDIELMPQNQDFGFQPQSRLEAVAQHTGDIAIAMVTAALVGAWFRNERARVMRAPGKFTTSAQTSAVSTCRTNARFFGVNPPWRYCSSSARISSSRSMSFGSRLSRKRAVEPNLLARSMVETLGSSPFLFQ